MEDINFLIERCKDRCGICYKVEGDRYALPLLDRAYNIADRDLKNQISSVRSDCISCPHKREREPYVANWAKSFLQEKTKT